jgi:hypothetical protein
MKVGIGLSALEKCRKFHTIKLLVIVFSALPSVIVGIYGDYAKILTLLLQCYNPFINELFYYL